MTEKRLLRDGDTPPLSTDQRAVFDAYFDRDGVVCTPAGSGTGKTTTAIEVVAEAVVRELHRRPNRNPFEEVLVTTFTRDAARQLKVELKSRLAEHRRAAPPGDPVRERWESVSRWLETESNVRTIDSFTGDLLGEVALETGVAPSFSVADGLRRSDLLESVFDELANGDLEAPIDRLEAAYPTDGDGPGWQSMVVECHRRCREFAMPVDEARRELVRSVGAMHTGRAPEDFEDLLAVVDDLTDYDPEHVRHLVSDPEAWVEHARETYRTSHRLAGDFGRVLGRFDEVYDERSRTKGALTHTDITHVVRSYLDADDGVDGAAEYATAADRRRDRFRESLDGRFRHVVVDEFQDTNYAQCRILAHLLGDANALLIGDLKQSIYEWRSAEPRLFARLVEYAEGETESNVLDAESVHPVPLAENFRSHPHLVGAANRVFPQVFTDPGRGGIGTFDVEYDRLDPRRVETDPEDAHVHVLRLDDPEVDPDQSRREALVETEAERVAATLRTVLTEGTLGVDREGTGDPDPVRPGDVAILFRTKTYMRRYAEVLESYGIDAAVIGTHSLFEEPEVRALVDALAWLGGPGQKTLERFVDSPAAGVSRATRDLLAAHDFDLDATLATVAGDRPGDCQSAGVSAPDPTPDDEDVSAVAREVTTLRRLREDLRWTGDGSKAELVTDLLARSAFDVAALGTDGGLQRYANLRKFVSVVDAWEDEETLSYGEFMRRLERLTEGEIKEDTTLADVTDIDSPETVKLLTAHTAKGLEFPVVVLADTAQNEAYHKVCDEPFVADRRHGVALQPRTGGSTQPSGEVFPTFSGGWFHEDDTGYDFDRGLLWLAEVRGDDGRIRHDHPLGGYVRDARAEFWRVLYVAFTRAADHLVVPLGTPRGSGARYCTWAAALGEHLSPNEDGVIETPAGDPDVPVGVDDIPPAEPPDGNAVDPVDVLRGTTDGTDVDVPTDTDTHADTDTNAVPVSTADGDGSSFRPAFLRGAESADLFDAPERFQRRALRGLSTLDDPDPGEPPPGTLPAPGEPAGVPTTAADAPDWTPGNCSAAAWGTVVHLALGAAFDPDGSVDPDPDADLDAVAARTVARVFGPRPSVPAVKPALDEVLAGVTSGTRTLDVARPAATNRALGTTLPVDGGTVEVTARADCVFEMDGTWRLVDWRVAPPPGEGTEAAVRRRAELDATALLCRRELGVAVDQATTVSLAGGWPVEKTVALDPDGFETDLRATLSSLYVEDGVLRR